MEIILKENERIDNLEYKNLKIIQNVEDFCFGVDSVLLSDFAKNIKNNAKVLDLGTGSGVIATLLCGKTNLKKITGVEIQKEVCEMANKSIKLNNLEEKFNILNENIKNIDKILEKESYDAIVTNPPYKKDNTGIKNEATTKLIARHEVECNLEDIVNVSFKLLKDKGEFYMVHRPERIAEIIYILKKHKLEPKVIRFVQGKVEQKPKLVLIKAIKNANEFVNILPTLILYNQDGTYTQEVLEIYNKEVE